MNNLTQSSTKLKTAANVVDTVKKKEPFTTAKTTADVKSSMPPSEVTR